MDEWAQQARARMQRERRRANRQAGGVTVRLSFYVSRATRQAIGDRISDRGREGPATAAEIKEWALDWIFNLMDDAGRIAECIELDCLDTDDDHDHADGSKR